MWTSWWTSWWTKPLHPGLSGSYHCASPGPARVSPGGTEPPAGAFHGESRGWPIPPTDSGMVRAATRRDRLEGRPSMEQPNGGVADNAGAPDRQAEAIDFVRFCHRRKHVGWPELYDEMCAVAGRGLYLGYGAEELGELGIGFGLFEMPSLAILVGKVVAEDMDRRRRTAEAVKATVVMTSKAPDGIGLGDGAET